MHSQEMIRKTETSFYSGFLLNEGYSSFSFNISH